MNMVHISPWSASEALFSNAATLLQRGAPLVLYGPFLRHDVMTAPSNLAFDVSLKACNPVWGLREVAATDALALANGLERTALVAMPANNLALIYRRV